MEKIEYKIMYQVEENHFWYLGMQKITKTLLAKFLPKLPKREILDAGCGSGEAMLFLKNFGRVTGIDISKEAIKFCKKRGLTSVQYASVDNLPFANQSFDLVASFDVLGQNEVKSDKRALSEFWRVLAPGGILILRVAAYNWLRSSHDIHVHTKHRYTRNEVEKLLKVTNFTPLKVSYVNSFLFPAILVKRIFNQIFPSSSSDIVQLAPIFNKILLIPLFIESFLIRFLNFPFGLSVIAVARR